MVEPIAVIARAAAAALVGDLELHVGDEVVARVAAVAGPDGRGVLSLAGSLHPARLPAGLREGQKLRLRVAGAEEGALVLRLARGADGEDGAVAPARAAGVLALRGDGQLLPAALALAGPAGALALPNGGSARVTVDDEPEGAGGRSGAASATVLLHSPLLGAIQVRLRLDAAGVSAAVEVEPAAAAAAERAAPELASGLERAVNGPAVVAVSARAEGARRPVPPRPEGVFDAYA